MVGTRSSYFPLRRHLHRAVQVTDASGWNATYGMHRADFVELLATALLDGVVHTGHRAVGFEQDDKKARVTFANGAVAEADIVVSADGIHSALREYAAPPASPVFSGSAAYRGLVSADSVPDWPRYAWLMWLGKGKHFLAFSGALRPAHQLRWLRACRT